MTISDDPSQAKLLGILTAGGFSPSERSAFESGKMISGTMESLTETELAAKFGCTIDVSVKDLTGVFLVSKRDTDTSAFQVGSMDELESLRLEPNREATAKMYIKGDSSLNLSKEEAALFHGLKNADEVEKVLRTILKKRYEQYLELGPDGIAPYSRGRAKNDYFSPGEELKVKSEKSVLCKQYAPNFHKVLMNYPSVKPTEEAFSWVNFTIDDKPTLCLVHKMSMMDGDVHIFCQRHFYVSRGHNSVQGIGGAFPISDNQCAVVYGSRTSTSQVTGFGGSAKRAIGSKIMTGKIAKNFEQAREKFNKK